MSCINFQIYSDLPGGLLAESGLLSFVDWSTVWPEGGLVS